MKFWCEYIDVRTDSLGRSAVVVGPEEHKEALKKHGGILISGDWKDDGAMKNLF